MEGGITVTQLKLKAGDSVQVKGTILPDAKGFAVNLGKDCDNIALHFNPRFDCYGDLNTIVCNSKQDGAWAEEMRESSFPFQQGEKAEISFTFDASELTIKLQDDNNIVFPNRTGLDTIQYLSVEGDIKIKGLKF